MKPNLSYLGMLLFLLCAAAFTHYLTNARASEAVPPHASLATFPEQLGSWKQVEVQTLTPGSIRELGADDFTSRTYVNDQGATVFLFIAYYASQRARSTYHSPQNCLPGAGWTLGAHRLHTLGAPGQVINEYMIEKDGAQMLALYWYHGRGRVVASEYWGRLYTLADAITRGRTDGALIRVIVPLSAQQRQDQAQEQARQAGLSFAQSLLPLLPGFVPN